MLPTRFQLNTFWLLSLSALSTQLRHTALHMKANHELTAQIPKIFAVLNLCHVSSEKVPKQNKQNSVWGQHSFQLCLTTFKLRYTTSYQNSNSDQACTKKHSTNTCWECDVLRHWVDWECITGKLKATLAVLQGQQPRHSNSTATRIYLPTGTAKEQGHGRTSYKVFSPKPLHQIEEDVGKISFNKSWGINMLVLCIKHLLPSKEHGKGTSKGQRNNMLWPSPFEVECWKTSK